MHGDESHKKEQGGVLTTGFSRLGQQEFQRRDAEGAEFLIPPLKSVFISVHLRSINSDFTDLLNLFNAKHVRCLIIEERVHQRLATLTIKFKNLCALRASGVKYAYRLKKK
ncbi:MAG TPA: hypothetical protein G4N98_09655 [Thermoflexia bacterium]|nr:hypothetical protein [Thermoflexia bacterium]